jgi:hypothetical protein
MKKLPEVTHQFRRAGNNATVCQSYRVGRRSAGGEQTKEICDPRKVPHDQRRKMLHIANVTFKQNEQRLAIIDSAPQR